MKEKKHTSTFHRFQKKLKNKASINYLFAKEWKLYRPYDTITIMQDDHQYEIKSKIRNPISKVICSMILRERQK